MGLCHICVLLWIRPSDGVSEGGRGRCLCVLYTSAALSNSTHCVCLHVFASFVSEGWGRKKGRCAFLISSPAVTPLNPPLKLSHNNSEWLAGAAMVKQSKMGNQLNKMEKLVHFLAAVFTRAFPPMPQNMFCIENYAQTIRNHNVGGNAISYPYSEIVH